MEEVGAMGFITVPFRGGLVKRTYGRVAVLYP